MAATVIPTRFRLRRDLAANWAAKNPTPLDGEPCLETDTGLRKLGDGSTEWNSLLYQLSGPAYDLDKLADGQAMLWDAANKRFHPGDPGKIYQPGSGISIDNPNSATPTISSTLGSIALSGRVDTYADLPTTLTSTDAGKAYLVDADQLIYVWNGTAWPTDGRGISAGGSKKELDVQNAILAIGPAMYWSLQSETNGLAPNLANSAYPLTMQGNRAYNASPVRADGKMLDLTGVGRGIMSLDTSLPLGGDRTVSLLLQPTSSASGWGFLQFGGDAFNEQLALINGTLRIGHHVSGSPSLNEFFSSFAIPSGTVCALSVMRDSAGKSYTVALNGAAVASYGYTSDPNTSLTDSTLYIGQNNNPTASSPIRLGHVAIWNTLLSATQIAQYANTVLS